MVLSLWGGQNDTLEKVLKNRPNLLIKGNNLIALHTLKEYFRHAPQQDKVKLIYIDPPYNTGNDSFNYNDRFNHSTWLTFMKNRLEIARELLRDDGVIFVQCDDNEQAYLKVLMDEIFGRENFVNSISVRSSTPSGLKTAHRERTIIKTKDFIIVYAKKVENLILKPQYIEVTKWDTHFNLFFDKKEHKVYPLKTILENNKIYENVSSQEYSLSNKDFEKFVYENADKIFQTGKSMPEDIRKISLLPENKDKPIEYQSQNSTQYAYNGRRMSFLENSIHLVISGDGLKNKISNLLCDFWADIDFNNTQNQGLVSFTSAKKPEQLLYRILDMTTQENDLVLDFFAGSGTTLAVAHKMKRRYIGIEQMDYIESITKERLKKVIEGEQGGVSKAVSWSGGGSLIYCELANLNAKFIDMIENSSDENELNQIYEKLIKFAFIDYRVDIQNDLKDLEFTALEFIEKKRILKKCLDRNMDYIPYADMEDSDYKIDERTKKLNDIFYKGSSDE